MNRSWNNVNDRWIPKIPEGCDKFKSRTRIRRPAENEQMDSAAMYSRAYPFRMTLHSPRTIRRNNIDPRHVLIGSAANTSSLAKCQVDILFS